MDVFAPVPKLKKPCARGPISQSVLPPRAHSISHSLVLPTRRRRRNPNPSRRRPGARAHARVSSRRRPTPLPPAPELYSRGPVSWSVGSAPWLRLAFEAMAGQWTGSPMKVPSTGSSVTASGQKGVPLLPCSFGPDTEQAAGDKGSVVSQVPVQH